MAADATARNLTAAANGRPKQRLPEDGQAWSSVNVTSTPPSSDAAML